MTLPVDEKEASRLIDALLADYDGSLKDDLSAKQKEDLLNNMAEITVGEQEGLAGADAIFGDFFVDMTGVAWSMLKAIVALGLAVAPDPSQLTKVAAFKIIRDLIKDTGGAFRRLTEDEQAVVDAIARKGGEHWRAEENYAVPLSDIEDYFKEQRSIVPPGLGDVLAGLAKKGVIEVIATLKHGDTYKIAF